MALGSGDILLYESSVAGSTGGSISSSTITAGVANNLWPDVTDAERLAGGERYRKVFWQNNSTTDAAVAPVMFVPILPTNMTISCGFGISHTDDDDPTQGNMTAWGNNAMVALVSDGADTRTATVVGLDDSGTPVPISESVTLNGTTEVLTANTFSEVWAVYLSGTEATREVTIAEGSGGTVRGTIGNGQIICWLWVVAPDTKGAGISLANLPAGSAYGMWLRLQWSAGIASVRPNSMSISLEESA